MIKSEDKSNVWELDQYFTRMKITDVTNRLPLAHINEQPSFDFNFDVKTVDGLKSISHDCNSAYISLTDDKYAAIGIKDSSIFVDVAHEEGDVTQSDLTVSWMPLGASDTDNSHMVRMYHSEIVEVFGSYEDFFKNPTAIIGWVAAHVAKGTPSQW